MTDDSDLVALKRALRTQALANRSAQPERESLSHRICQRLSESDEYRAARSVLFYVEARAEVSTRPLLIEALSSSRTVAVPYCVADELKLFRLTQLDELEPGAYRIPEPRSDLRQEAQRRVEMAALDLILVPGVAFDRAGGRLGHGFGYYDRLLTTARADTLLVGLAFECQIFDTIPMTPEDVSVDWIVSEQAVYRGRGRSAANAS